MHFRGLTVGAAFALTVAACGLDTEGTMADQTGSTGGTGAPDGATPSPSADGGVWTDGGSPGDAADGSAASSDGSAADSAPPPPVDAGCPGTPEVCTDGIDNDCNGLVDCADPACSMKTTCEPPVASGWAVIAFNAAGTGPCPGGFGSPTDAYSLTGSPQAATCGCSCSVGDPPSCVIGNNVTIYSDGQMACPLLGSPWPNNDGACVDLPNPVPSKPNSGARVTPLPASGGTCKPTASNPPPPPAPVQHGRVCSLQGSAGGGCSNGGVCAPNVGGGYQVCVQQAGDVACPSGYTKKTLVGTSTQDGRTCSGSCMCGAPSATCANAQFTFYANAGCTGHALALNADDKCDPVTDGPMNNYASHKYTADVQNVACGAPIAQPTPSGTVTLQSPHTVCCP